MSSDINFLRATSVVSTLMRNHDWTQFKCGEPSQWSRVLRMAISLSSHTNVPTFVLWGADMSMFYNDAYLSILANKHPAALGSPIAQVWPEIWEEIAPLLKQAYTGEPASYNNQAFKINRKGFDEIAWFDFSLAPLFEGAEVKGIFCSLHETTDKILAADRHTEELERWQQIFEQAPGAIAIMRGAEHIFQYANASYKELVGHRQLIGKSVRAALPEVIEQGFIKLLDQVFHSGEPHRGNSVAVTLSKTVAGDVEKKLMDFVYQPIKDAQGRVTGIFVEGFDVTEKVRSASVLRDADQRLHQLANTIPQLAWIADASGAITWYNQRWYDYTGTNLAQMQGWGWQSVHHPDYLPKVLERWHESLTLGQSFEMTFPIKGADGIFRPFFSLAVPLKDGSGQIKQWFGTNTDVSSLHKSQEALQKAEEWLKEGLLAGRMVVWEWDLAADELKYSDNAQEVLGFVAANSSIGWASVHPDDVGRLQNAIKKALQERSYFQEKTRRIRPDNGELIWIETKGRVINDFDNQPKAIRGIMVDITERVKAEHDLREVNRRKDDFLAMLAHELRNPLAPISTAAQLLKLVGNDEQRVHQAGDIIARQVKHMTDLVDDLLDVSRVTRGLVELQRETVDIKLIVTSAVEQARPLIEARRHTLITHMHAAQAYVNGDRTRLIQVVANLLNNAAKYTPPGGEITLSIEVKLAEVHVRVQDNGIGIDSSLLPHVFDLFTQAERTPDRALGGLGLGLALVKSIMHLHGGRAEAKSDGRAKGSTFTAILPLMDGFLKPPPPPEPPPILVTNTLSIMIVDDNVDAAVSLATLLEAHGHTVSVWSDSASALAACAQHSYDIFILDIGLPGMDGYELASHLKALAGTGDALFIALTGYSQTRDRVMSAAAGFDYHFVKPLDLHELEKIFSSVT